MHIFRSRRSPHSRPLRHRSTVTPSPATGSGSRWTTRPAGADPVAKLSLHPAFLPSTDLSNPSCHPSSTPAKPRAPGLGTAW